MRVLSRVLCAVLVLSTSLCAFAKGAQYPVAKVTITGGAPYSDAEILSIAALKPGDVLTLETLAGPAQRLLDTGMFDSAEMEMIGSGSRTAHLSLKPVPMDKLLPTSFENFVWWTPQELAEAIRAKVPLYRGACSDAGNLPDLVQAVLEQLLAEKGVQATTSHTIVEPTTEQPRRVVNFRIESPHIGVASVNVSGAPPELATAMQQISQRAMRMGFNEGLSGMTTEQVLLLPALDAGYLTAGLVDVQRAVARTSAGIGVAYSARLVAGEPYKVAGITWEATPVYSGAEFSKDAALHAGDLASAKPLRGTEAKIIAAYRAQGYIDAYVTPSPKLDGAAHTVSYALQVVPGEVYRLKSVTPLNLTPAAQQDFETAWRMKPNDVYNEAYVSNFITNNSALKHLSVYSASFKAVGDPETHLVDLTIMFVAGSGR
jgi:outer membrane protein assembly factor BamA